MVRSLKSGRQRVSGPRAIARITGGFLIADSGNHRAVSIDDAFGSGWRTFGAHGSGAGEFNQPTGVAVDSKSRIYIADTGNRRVVRLLLETNASYLYSNGTERGGRALGGDARLICFDKTDGFLGSESGSDDIEIDIGVNGVNAAHIPHSDELVFDDDTRRDIVMPTIAYTSEAKFELVELDDFSPADRASAQIPMLPAAVTAAKQITVDSDDGHYELEITVSREPPID